MKNTKICPKCQTANIVRFDGYAGPHGFGNHVLTGNTFFGSQSKPIHLLRLWIY